MSVTDLETRVRLLEAQVGEHVALSKEKFAGGQLAFNGLRESIGQLSQAVQPKPVSLGRVVGLTVTMVALAAGALWGLSTMISDRPTVDQMRSVISDHASNGHPALTGDIATIKQEQAVQKVKIESIASDMAEIKAVLVPRIVPTRRPR